MPVMVARAEHLDEDYRPAGVAVKWTGTDARESGVRLSFTP